jgi:hypothetical protein
MGKALAFVFCLLPVVAQAQEGPSPAKAAEEKKPAIEQLDATRYKLGTITFDKLSREIRFPATVNMTEGLLEFLIVHERGKIHESLFATDISPTQLNVVFTLLRYPASKEFYAIDVPSEREPGTEFPQVAADVKAGARVIVKVEWKNGEKVRTVPVNEWISHAVTEKQMPNGPWVYGGSEISNGRYQAEATGDIAAIFLSNSAILNYPGQDNNNDDVWLPFPKRVPPIGTKVTLIITPNSAVEPASDQ